MRAWGELQEDDDHDDEDDLDEEDEESPGYAGVEVLVRRDGEDSFSLVSWEMSLHNGQWLIDSLNIV